MHRPLKGERQSVAKLHAEYQIGPTRDQYVYSPSKPMGDPGTTLGIGLPCFNYVHSLHTYDNSYDIDQSHDKEGSEFADDLGGMVLHDRCYNC